MVTKPVSSKPRLGALHSQGPLPVPALLDKLQEDAGGGRRKNRSPLGSTDLSSDPDCWEGCWR